MKKFLIVLILLSLPIFVSAQAAKKKAVYFYADWCSHCQKVNAYFEEKNFYEKYDIQKLDYNNSGNRELLAEIFKKGGHKSGGIPTVIVGEEIISGDTPIIENFETKIEKSEKDPAVYVEDIRRNIRPDSEPAVAYPVLIGAALVDAINPCAFAVLIILLATVISARGRNNALFSGLLFSLAVFISYLLMGLGVYKAIAFFDLPRKISLVVGAAAILIGLANLKDAFWHGKVFLMEVPMSWRPKMKVILQRATSPFGAFGAGFIVSLFLLPCTSGPYVVILGIMAQNGGISKAFSLLVLYNFIFILPMIAITAAMYAGVRMKKLEQWRQENLRLLHAVAGVIMLLVGGYLIKGWI